MILGEPTAGETRPGRGSGGAWRRAPAREGAQGSARRGGGAAGGGGRGGGEPWAGREVG